MSDRDLAPRLVASFFLVRSVCPDCVGFVSAARRGTQGSVGVYTVHRRGVLSCRGAREFGDGDLTGG